MTIELAATVTGFSPAAIRSKIHRGIWINGRQWVKRDGRVLFDMKRYGEWAQGNRKSRLFCWIKLITTSLRCWRVLLSSLHPRFSFFRKVFCEPS